LLTVIANTALAYCAVVRLAKHCAVYTIEQTSSKRRADIEQTSSSPDGTRPLA